MRPDLLGLDPDTLAALSNRGLVKRAQREIEAGQGPRLEEREDTTVLGTFPDGVVATLAPGRRLVDTTCTCGATAVCRHRVAVALSYATFSGGAREERRSPWEITDDDLLAFLGPRLIQGARQAGLHVQVERPATGFYTARLPTSTVRFFGIGDLPSARCDCEAGGACVHVAQAVWAFREAQQTPGVLAEVTLFPPRGAPPSLDEARTLVHDVLRQGITTWPADQDWRFERVRRALEGAGATWPALLVEDLEEQVVAYRARSARYRPALAVQALLSLEARRLALGRASSPEALLGVGIAPETRLDKIRLLSLGAKVEDLGPSWGAEVLLADPEGATVLSVRKEWPKTGEEQVDLGARLLFPGVRLRDLARGALLTEAGRRRAGGRLVVGRGASNVVPQRGDWAQIPPPIRVEDLAVLRDPDLPPPWLRPPVVAPRLHVLAVEEVVDPVWDPVEQAVRAVLVHPSGEVELWAPFSAVSPGGVAEVARALLAGPCWVAGDLSPTPTGYQLVPTALVAQDELIVPALSTTVGEVPLPLGGVAPSPRSGVHEARALLEQALHLGLSGLTPAHVQRWAAVSAELGAAGLLEAGARLGRGPGPEAWVAAALWIDALELSPR